MFLSRLLESVKTTAQLAGDRLWDIYQSGDFVAEQKADDSPVTTADYAAKTRDAY